ncbi:MmgE/PrpD family protein [Mesorhizobium sp. M0968]|uniref:MmgE/PrpD family protein n=1 Tax=Mesorhizobium sp. M0968 TaxID=2957037 RepID=UPI00333CF31D
MYATEELACFVVSHPKGRLRSLTREAASLLTADLIAAAAAGSRSTLATAARSAATELYGKGEVSIWFTDISLSIAGAAKANAAAASALDIDDGHRGAAGHPGAGIIPTALAIGQAHRASDVDILEAIVLGYDVALRVAASRPAGSVASYSSGRWVGFGVAAAAGRLLALNAVELANALSIAAAEGPIGFPTGTSKFQGTTVKEGIPPAVIAGLTAAFRAKAGATGPLDILDNTERYTRELLTGKLGQSWHIEQCYLKPYACCRYMHAAIDAILALRSYDRPIRSLKIQTFPQALKLSNARVPSTLEAGQYSFFFSCALAATYGAASLQPVNPARLRDPKVLDLAEKIELTTHEDFAQSFPATTPCRVILDEGNGPKSLTIVHPLGDLKNPMSREKVREKFLRLTASTVERGWQDTILDALDGLLTRGFKPLFAALPKQRV